MPWCYYEGQSFDPKECEDDYLRGDYCDVNGNCATNCNSNVKTETNGKCGGTKVYVNCSGNGGDDTRPCKKAKEECEEPTAPATKSGFRITPLTRTTQKDCIKEEDQNQSAVPPGAVAPATTGNRGGPVSRAVPPADRTSLPGVVPSGSALDPLNGSPQPGIGFVSPPDMMLEGDPVLVPDETGGIVTEPQTPLVEYYQSKPRPFNEWVLDVPATTNEPEIPDSSAPIVPVIQNPGVPAKLPPITPNPSGPEWICYRKYPPPPENTLFDNIGFPEEVLGEPTIEDLNTKPRPLGPCPPPPPQPPTVEEVIANNTEYEEDLNQDEFTGGGIVPPVPPPTPPPSPGPCIPYEPPLYALDTRVEPNLEIPFDYLWGLEVSFPYNPFPRLFFTMFTTTAVNATTKPANIVFYAYRAGTAWNARWPGVSVAGPETPVPPNPDPTHYNSAHWTYVYQAKWRYTNQVPNYGIERYGSLPYPSDTQQNYAQQLEKVPMTGFLNGGVMSIAQLTTNYDNTIHYKTQFTLDEAKETAYMYYFKDTRYLPASIQTAVTGADINPLFSSWSASDVTDFKAWALVNATTTNKYHSAPAVQGTCIPDPGDPGGPPPTPAVGNQYTPDFTSGGSMTEAEMIDGITAASQAADYIFSQDPDGHSQITPTMWANAKWDGVAIDPTAMTQADLCTWIKPVQEESHLVIRGIRDLFYEVRPFVDDSNPTPREIDLWNIEVVRHFRRMFGIATPVNLDARLDLEARWASERKYTQDWDGLYPLDCGGGTTKGGPCGPCFDGGTPVDTAGGHCGAAFWPDSGDRAAYISADPYLDNTTDYPELAGYTVRRANAEGVSATGVEVPWSLKLASIIANWICAEGYSGHPGPYVNPATARTTMGFDWWYDGGASVAFRGKYR